MPPVKGSLLIDGGGVILLKELSALNQCQRAAYCVRCILKMRLSFLLIHSATVAYAQLLHSNSLAPCMGVYDFAYEFKLKTLLESIRRQYCDAERLRNS